MTAVREGQDASVECDFRGNYVDFRRKIGDKEQTIFVRTGKTNNDLDSSWEIISRNGIEQRYAPLNMVKESLLMFDRCQFKG